MPHATLPGSWEAVPLSCYGVRKIQVINACMWYTLHSCIQRASCSVLWSASPAPPGLAHLRPTALQAFLSTPLTAPPGHLRYCCQTCQGPQWIQNPSPTLLPAGPKALTALPRYSRTWPHWPQLPPTPWNLLSLCHLHTTPCLYPYSPQLTSSLP